jgi:flagellar basal-body rod modification protein FlgD
LLVTEMQNQDPTADTDPNEYINQLVQVNSLEQLIDINQTLTTAYPTPTSSTPSTDASAQPGLATKSTSSLAATAPQPTAGGSLSSLQSALTSHTKPSQTGALPAGAIKSSATSQAAGNFTVPGASPAAVRVAHSLNGKSRASPGQSPPWQTSPTSKYPAQ